VYPSRRHLSAKVRAFIDFLVARFAADPAWNLATPPT
jgi:DNA-binding transcriptional LysR family regulator